MNKLLKWYKPIGFIGFVKLLLHFGIMKKGVFSLKPKILLNKIKLRANGSDVLTFNQIILEEHYNLNTNLNPKFIIDAGANIGLASAYFASKYKNAIIISLEPEKANYQLLLENTKNYANVKPINFGLWYKKTNLSIENKDDTSWAFIVKECESENKDTIKAIDIDYILETYNIDFIDILKIDIEGSEKEVFESNYANWLPKTKILIIELHDFIKNGTAKSVFSALVKYDFNMEISGENLVFINNSFK